VKRINGGKATGLNDIPSKLLKIAAGVVTPALPGESCGSREPCETPHGWVGEINDGLIAAA